MKIRPNEEETFERQLSNYFKKFFAVQEYRPNINVQHKHIFKCNVELLFDSPRKLQLICASAAHQHFRYQFEIEVASGATCE